MKSALGLGLLALAACTSAGQPASNVGERLAADVGCVTALAAAGLSVASNPATGKVDAVAVLGRIHAAGTSNVPAATLGACADTIGYALQDGQGLHARIKGLKK